MRRRRLTDVYDLALTRAIVAGLIKPRKQLRCCDCGEPFPGLTEDDLETRHDVANAQCERCHRHERWIDPEEELT